LRKWLLPLWRSKRVRSGIAAELLSRTLSTLERSIVPNGMGVFKKRRELARLGEGVFREEEAPPSPVVVAKHVVVAKKGALTL
jgi:hypothetical protein